MKHGVLLSCFGAEANHRFSAAIFDFSYRKPSSTALAYDLRRLFHDACAPQTYEPFYLSATVSRWHEVTRVFFDGIGLATVVASSTEVSTPTGRYAKGDVAEWQHAGRHLGKCECFCELHTANGGRLWVAGVNELAHEGLGVWKPVHDVLVNAPLFFAAIPFCSEGGFVRPLYVSP